MTVKQLEKLLAHLSAALTVYEDTPGLTAADVSLKSALSMVKINVVRDLSAKKTLERRARW
ncbi:MAG: hypothetical protein JWM35_2233 [Verrucomicrobia bacterium]|nr:hypothetical protein [Verrucomicrobiota bacterium]